MLLLPDGEDISQSLGLSRECVGMDPPDDESPLEEEDAPPDNDEPAVLVEDKDSDPDDTQKT